MCVFKCEKCGSNDLDGFVSGTFTGQIDCDDNIEEIQVNADYKEFTCQNCGHYWVVEE